MNTPKKRRVELIDERNHKNPSEIIKSPMPSINDPKPATSKRVTQSNQTWWHLYGNNLSALLSVYK